MQWHLIFPLLSSLLYVAGILFIKRAADLGVGVWRATIVSNLAAAVIFLCLLPFGGEPIQLTLLWQPLIVATLFIAGQTFTFISIDRGDVSIATPALGIKTIIVAWLSVILLNEQIPWQLWVSAVLTFLAIGLLNTGQIDKTNKTKSIHSRTITFALLAAISYALFDVLVQKWAPAWGAGRFLPIMFTFCALLSLVFIPLCSSPLGTITKSAWIWLVTGAAFIGLQALSLVTSLAVFGDATAMNVIYSSRGLWSVIAVWMVGHWFHNREQSLPQSALRMRLFGAVIMTLAIVITLSR